MTVIHILYIYTYHNNMQENYHSLIIQKSLAGNLCKTENNMIKKLILHHWLEKCIP
jgi:hypothetical protein